MVPSVPPPPPPPVLPPPKKAKSNVVKLIGIGVAALLIGLARLGVFPDIGVAQMILDAVGFSNHPVAVQPIPADDDDADAGIGEVK